jgi:hypothetical protein
MLLSKKGGPSERGSTTTSMSENCMRPIILQVITMRFLYNTEKKMLVDCDEQRRRALVIGMRHQQRNVFGDALS